MLKMPYIMIDGKKYVAPRPTLATWRECVRFAEEEKKQQEKEDTDLALSAIQLVEGRLAIVQKFYNIPDSEVDKMDPADIVPAYRELSRITLNIVFEKLKVDTPKNVEAEQESK